MFANANRPFAANTNTFGTPPANPFVQPQIFGTTGSTFGNTSTFGQNTTPMFASQPQSTNLFSTASTSGFGTNQSAFGSNSIFGHQNQPSTSLFGTATNTFGQQTKPNSFSFPPQPSVFGQTTTQPNNVFQSSGSTNIFASPSFGIQSNQTGTVIKFVPVSGTDSMQKSGSTTVINTKHHCITCMKEYENKSFEELRFEDYGANRKGPQQTSAFGAPSQPFGAAPTTTSMFGQPDNKTGFGTTNGFGQTSAFGISSQPNSSMVFGKPATGFGAGTTTSNFGITNTAGTSTIFGAASTAKPFGSEPTSLFGSAQQPTSIFGQPATTQQNTNTFYKPTQPTFSQPTGFLSFNQTPASTQPSSIFQTSKPNTGFNMFGPNTATSTSFGQSATQPFGGFVSSFKPAQPVFGQPNQQAPSFGAGLNMPSNNLFGNLNNKPAFGTAGTNLFSNTGLQSTNNAFSLQMPNTTQPISLTAPPQATELRSVVNTTDPYGFQPHLELLSKNKSNTYYVTNPKDLHDVLRNNQEIKPVNSIMKKIKVGVDNEKWLAFDTVYDEHEPDFVSASFTSKNNPKRLLIRSVPQKKPPVAASFDFESRQDLNLSVGYMNNSFDIPNSSNLQSDANEKNNTTTDILEQSTLGVNTENTFNESVVNNEKETPNTSTKTADYDTCGIICTRPEYYTIPSLDKIAEYKNEDGSCLIKGFTIGRLGYGNVYFPDLMDVSNLNIDELVHFRSRELCIYMDDENKPPVGEGLNRRAQVTLDRVFPRKEDDEREIETSPDVLITTRYAETLKSACLRVGTTFLDYRPETGSWVFNVDHFSKYGLPESEETKCREDAMKRLAAEKKENQLKQQDAMNQTKDQPKIQEKEQVKQKEDSDAYLKKGLGGLPRNNLANLSYHMDYPIGYNTDPMSEISMAIEEEPILCPRDMLETGTINRMKTVFLQDAFDFDDAKERELSSSPTNIEAYNELIEVDMIDKDYTRVLPHREEEKRCPYTMYKLQNPSMCIPLSHSLIPNHGYMDAAIFKGRSFKVGWARGFTIATLFRDDVFLEHDSSMGSSINSVEADLSSPSCVVLLEVSKTCSIYFLQNEKFSDPFMNYINDYMDIVLKHSEIQLQIEDQIPYYKINKDRGLLGDLCEYANNLFYSYPNNEKMQYYKNIWNLCKCLWDEAPRNVNETTYRRKNFSKWLENVTVDLVDQDLVQYKLNNGENALKKMMVYLSGHQVLKAAELAMKSKFPQLALLLTQLNSNSGTKEFIQQQIHQWNATGVLKNVSSDVLKLYLIVCGMSCYESSNVCEYLDWIRCLALHFWYLCPREKPLTHSIQMYEEAFNKYGYAEKPYPLHGTTTETWDILYHIMKLYCYNQTSLQDILPTLTHTDDPTDYRLSWLLLQTFLSLGVGVIEDKAIVYLCTLFSTELEQLGLYKWAIFVLLFIPDLSLRKNLVLGVLDRNLVDDDTSDKAIENELVLTFHIPAEWIHNVKAVKVRDLRNHWTEFQHLSYSEKWNECNNLALEKIVPSLILNHHFVTICKIFKHLELNKNQISNWKYKGGIIHKYAYFWVVLNKIKTSSKNAQLDYQSFYKEVNAFLKTLKYYPVKSQKQSVLIAEVSKCTAILLNTVLQHIKADNPDSEEIGHTNYLIMPFDYMFEEVQKSLLKLLDVNAKP